MKKIILLTLFFSTATIIVYAQSAKSKRDSINAILGCYEVVDNDGQIDLQFDKRGKFIYKAGPGNITVGTFKISNNKIYLTLKNKSTFLIIPIIENTNELIIKGKHFKKESLDCFDETSY